MTKEEEIKQALKSRLEQQQPKIAAAYKNAEDNLKKLEEQYAHSEISESKYKKEKSALESALKTLSRNMR